MKGQRRLTQFTISHHSVHVANMQKYLIALVVIAAAVSSATLPQDAVKIDADSSSPVESVANNRMNSRIRRQTPSTFTSASVPVINGAGISSTSLTRVQAPEVKTLASQLDNNSVDAKEVDENKLLGGLLGGLPILGGLLPNSPQCVYNNNCQFLGLTLYVVLNIFDPVVCGNEICAGDAQCTHFTHNPVTKECILHKAPGTGGGWATLTPAVLGAVCGHIPKRSCGAGSLLSLCLGLDIGLLGGLL